MSSHPQIPDDVAALISAYALGALEPDQEALAEQHIAASDDCRRAYEDALETSAALALAVADSEPPAGLRDRIVAAARAERPEPAPVAERAAPSWRSRLGRLLTPSAGFAVVGVTAAIVFGLVAVSQHDAANGARDRAEALAALLAAPDARVVPVQQADGTGAAGRVVVSQGRAALVSSLGSPPAGRTYQAWGIPDGGGAPVPLPTFSKPGSVLILNDVGDYKQLAVTVEPNGGSKAPSTAPVAAARL
jgi:anti-sigma-K factor RskA